jgi:hypothetical protein
MQDDLLCCGIDFSADQHQAGSHTWVTVGRPVDGTLEVTECRPAWQLPGSGKDRPGCMAGLRRFLAERPNLVAGLDFPFGLPRSLVPDGTWREFVLAFADRYPSAEAFRLACREATGPFELKRVTDRIARTPFSPYNIRVYRQTYAGIAELLAPLIREDAVRVPPMQAPADGKATLLEICPASCLLASRLRVPYKGRGSELRAARAHILAEMLGARRVSLPPGLDSVLVDDPGGDALDSLIAAVSVLETLPDIAHSAESVPEGALVEAWVFFSPVR